MPKSANQICNAIRNNQYFGLSWKDDDINKIDSPAYVNDALINFHGRTTPLHYAALKGRFDIVADLINRGASPEISKDIVYSNLKYKFNLTAFLYKVNKAQLVNLLNHFFSNDNNEADIKNKITASVNVGYRNGNTLLMKAIKDGWIDLVQKLINAGANVNAKNSNGKTALYIAISQKKYDIAELLLDMEEINVSITPAILHVAIKNSCKTDIIKNLINKFAAIELRDGYGNTPLILAGKKGNVEIIKLLITKGANKNATNKQKINWEKAYKKKLMIPVYCASIVTLAALPYAIIGSVVTNNLFTSFEKFNPNGWNISIIAAYVVFVISFISLVVYGITYNESIDKIKKLIKEQSSTQQNKIQPKPSAPPNPNQEQKVGNAANVTEQQVGPEINREEADVQLARQNI